MLKIRVANQYFNGENESKNLVITQTYGGIPVQLDFQFPDGNTLIVKDLMCDESGNTTYPLPDEIMYQNGRVSVQATVVLPTGAVEKSSVVTFPVGRSINAEDNLTLFLHNKRLYPKGGNCIAVVGDNKDYKIKFENVENLGSIFAIFNRDGKSSSPIMLSDDGEVSVPLWVLKSGSFEVGLYANGFASTPLSITVQRSIVDQDGIITEDPDSTIVEQLLKKVDDIKYIKICKVVDGRLMIYLNDGSEINAGFVGDGGGTITSVQSDQEQNDSSQPDYIKNRTHYKEIDEAGKTVYHTLDNKYLNLDNEVKQNSDNPVTAKAVYKAVDESEPKSLSNIEIEELLKNFV